MILKGTIVNTNKFSAANPTSSKQAAGKQQASSKQAASKQQASSKQAASKQQASSNQRLPPWKNDQI